MTVLQPQITININLSGRYCRNSTQAGLESLISCPYRNDEHCILFEKELNIGKKGEWVRLKECKQAEV